jgi:enoyl-CoA hydratase/carnithine racemase
MIPQRLAMEIVLTGDAISAERAYEIGLVNKVVPDERLVNESQNLAETIAANAPLSVLAAKRTVRLVAERPLSMDFDEAERIREPVYLSGDAKEGPRAFRDSRAPNRPGR